LLDSIFGPIISRYCLENDCFFATHAVVTNWKPESSSYVSVLFLLSGDISMNPGPIQYPCTVCHKSVNSNHKAVQCDDCQLWSHIRCVSTGDSMYQKPQDATDFSWQCLCLFSELPNVDVIDNILPSSFSTDSNSISLVGDVLYTSFSGIHNSSGLHSKMDDLASWFSVCNEKMSF